MISPFSAHCSLPCVEKHLALLSLWASAFNNVGCIARDLSADLFGGRFWVEEG